MLELFLGQIPEAIYFALFMIYAKNLKTKRLLYTILMILEEELEMCMEDMREQSRKLEDIAEMSENPQEKNNLMKIAEKQKEYYRTIKTMMDKM